MNRHVSLWPVAVVALTFAGYCLAQGIQPNFIRNLLSPIITGPTTANGDLTVNGDAGVSGAVSIGGVTTGPTFKANVVDAGTISGGNYLLIDPTLGDRMVTITAAGGVTNVQTLSSTELDIDAPGGSLAIGANSGTTSIGKAGNATTIVGNVTLGGGTGLTKYLSGTVAVTGASINAGLCANQGTAITETGAAAGDACYLGLSASPGNGLAYSCVTGSNTCQIVACNASAGSLTSLTGTHRCTVIH